MNISLTIRDNLYAKEVDAVAELNGWTAEIANPAFVEGGAEPATIPNPVGKIQFFNAWLKKKAINEITERDNRIALSTVVPVIDTEV